MYFKGVKLPSFSKPIITFPWDKKWSVNWHHPTSHPTSLIYPSLLIFSKEKPTIQQVHKNIGFYKKNPIQCFYLQYWFHKSIIFTMDYAFSAFSSPYCISIFTFYSRPVNAFFFSFSYTLLLWSLWRLTGRLIAFQLLAHPVFTADFIVR